MKNKQIEVIQSYVLTSAKYDFSVYEKRILFRIVEHLQNELDGKPLNKRCHIQKNLFDDRRFTMPISEFLNGEKDKNHARVKKALTDLRNKAFEYEDESVWEYLGIIERPSIDKYKTTVEFTVTPKLYECFLNFAKGYKRYELTTAFQFESVYAMRFYELLAGQINPLSYSVDALKDMFGLSDKYNRTSNFIARVVDVAKKELDAKSPYSFIYKTNRDEDGGRKIHTLYFYPVRTEHADDFEEMKKVRRQSSPGWDLPQHVINYLKSFGFESKDLKNNLDLLIWANANLDIPVFLSGKKRYIEERAKNPVGYIIGVFKNARKKELEKSKKKPS